VRTTSSTALHPFPSEPSQKEKHVNAVLCSIQVTQMSGWTILFHGSYVGDCELSHYMVAIYSLDSVLLLKSQYYHSLQRIVRTCENPLDVPSFIIQDDTVNRCLSKPQISFVSSQKFHPDKGGNLHKSLLRGKGVPQE